MHFNLSGCNRPLIYYCHYNLEIYCILSEKQPLLSVFYSSVGCHSVAKKESEGGVGLYDAGETFYRGSHSSVFPHCEE